MIFNVLFGLGVVYLLIKGVCKYSSSSKKYKEIKIETDSYEYQKELKKIIEEHDKKEFKDLKEMLDWNYKAYDRLRKVKYQSGNER